MSQLGAETSLLARLILIGFSLQETLTIFGAIFGVLGVLILILYLHTNYTRRTNIQDAFVRRFWNECDSKGIDDDCDCGLCRALKGDRVCMFGYLSQTIYEMDLEEENRRQQHFDHRFKASQFAAEREAREMLEQPQFLQAMQVRVRNQRTVGNYRE